MIEILKPFLDSNVLNKIIYPVYIYNNLYNFYIKYNISEKLDLNLNIDAIVIMLSSIAICNKWKIKSECSIDEKLYNNLLQLPNTYKKYHSKHTSLLGMLTYEEINLILDIPICNRSNTNYGLHCNITPISMGVDSLHTILLNKNDLTHLIYINNLDRSIFIEDFKKNMKKFSDKYNKNLIIADSNFKQLIFSLKLNNNISMHGTNYAVFTSDAIQLASSYPLGINSIYLSGCGYKNIPCIMGQHNEINKYFISNEYNIIDNEETRIKKINYIINNDNQLIKYLRVCNDNTSGFYINCSNCLKCNLTIFYFFMLGYYDELNDIFILPKKDEIINNLKIFHKNTNKDLSTKYDDLIYEQYLNLYLNNNEQPINNIIDNYYGEFIGENYILLPKF